MKQIRYRTESFSGTKERDAAEVMAFETFELGNTDILEYVSQHYLKDKSLLAQCSSFIRELDNNGYVDDMSMDDKVDFFHAVLSEIEKQTGVPIKYALWLADKNAVCNSKWYGRNMRHAVDFDSYEVGPVILSDLGYDGALYGYVQEPICLEDRIADLQHELFEVLNEQDSGRFLNKRKDNLNTRYMELDASIQEICGVLESKHLRDTPFSTQSLSEQIQSAANRARNSHSDNAKENLLLPDPII